MVKISSLMKMSPIRLFYAESDRFFYMSALDLYQFPFIVINDKDVDFLTAYKVLKKCTKIPVVTELIDNQIIYIDFE